MKPHQKEEVRLLKHRSLRQFRLVPPTNSSSSNKARAALEGAVMHCETLKKAAAANGDMNLFVEECAKVENAKADNKIHRK